MNMNEIKTTDLVVEKENLQDEVRTAVLAALDEVAAKHGYYGQKAIDIAAGCGQGWLDKDLSSFIPAIDQQSEKLFNRLHGLE